MPGAFVTVIVLLIILAFATYRTIVFVTRDDPDISKQSYMRNLDREGELYPGDFGFQLAFGLEKSLSP